MDLNLIKKKKINKTMKLRVLSECIPRGMEKKMK